MGSSGMNEKKRGPGPGLRLGSATELPRGGAVLLRLEAALNGEGGQGGEGGEGPFPCVLSRGAAVCPVLPVSAAKSGLVPYVSMADARVHRQLSRILEGEARRRGWAARGYLTCAPPPAPVPAAEVPAAGGPVGLWYVPFRWDRAGGAAGTPVVPPPEVLNHALFAAARAGCWKAPGLRVEPGASPGRWEDEYRATVRGPGTVARALREAGFTRGLLRAISSDGYVLLDGVPVVLDEHLGPPAHLRALLPAPPRGAVGAQPGPLDVVYEDEDLLVVNKPPGLLVHPARRTGEPSLAGRVIARLLEQGKTPLARPVGRLDRGTSGLAIFACTRFCQVALSGGRGRGGASGGGMPVKEYLAVVSPRPDPCTGEFHLTSPVASPPSDPRRYSHPRPARTACRTLRRWPEAALVCAIPETGRTHQIRRHLAAAGMPLLGDREYGGEAAHVGRPALHAWRVTFSHPVTRRRICLRAPLPGDIRALLALLRGRHGGAAPRHGGAAPRRGGAGPPPAEPSPGRVTLDI